MYHPQDTHFELSAARATKAHSVANAVPEVLAATGVIGANTEDGVLRHLRETTPTAHRLVPGTGGGERPTAVR